MKERAKTFSEELLERSILENGLDYTIEQLQNADLL